MAKRFYPFVFYPFVFYPFVFYPFGNPWKEPSVLGEIDPEPPIFGFIAISC